MSNEPQGPTPPTEPAEAEERTTLRALRDRLHAQGEELRQDVESARDSTDAVALHALNGRLMKQNEALSVYHKRLEAFHSRYGPLGE